MERVKEIANNTLTDKTRESFCDKFLDCKNTMRGATPLVQWDQQEHSVHRLELLNAFINRRLKVLHKMSSNKVAGKHSSAPRQGSKVTDTLERYSCPLCSTPHRAGEYSVRPWLAACVKFLEMNIRDRNATCARLKHCKSCTRDIEKNHKGADTFPLAENFSCRHCTGDKRFTHCSLLCFSQDTPKGRLGQGQFGGQPPGDNDKPPGCRGGGHHGSCRGRGNGHPGN